MRASARALPRSQGLGMTKQPASCSRRKTWQRSEDSVMTNVGPPRGPEKNLRRAGPSGPASVAGSEKTRPTEDGSVQPAPATVFVEADLQVGLHAQLTREIVEVPGGHV